MDPREREVEMIGRPSLGLGRPATCLPRILLQLLKYYYM